MTFAIHPANGMQLLQNPGASHGTKGRADTAHRFHSYVDANLHALRKIPDVRADEVARARALVQDPSYPLPEILRQIAFLLAGKLH